MAPKTRSTKHAGAGDAIRAEGAPRIRGRAVAGYTGAGRPVASRRLLDEARRALGVTSDAAAIRAALEAVVVRERQAQGILRLAGLGPVDASRID
jgi:hypothetical protein